MAKSLRYICEFQNVRIRISSLNIRRRRDAPAFCSVTIPDGEQHTLLITNNPTGTLVIIQIDENDVETTIGTYILNQVLPTESPSAITIVLNAQADFGTDLAPSGLTFQVPNPITTSNDSLGIQRFSAAEDGRIVVGDIINLRGVNVTVEEITFFVAVNNSRMDVGVI